MACDADAAHAAPWSAIRGAEWYRSSRAVATAGSRARRLAPLRPVR